jgi:putative ABC transport system permease protein
VHTIVGVMPSGLVLPDMLTPEVWTPAALDIALNMQPGWNTRWDGGRVIARLKDRLPRGRAQGELDLVARQFGREHRKRSGVLEARLVPLGTDILRADRARQLSMLAIIVGTGLLLACVNLAGLLLARSLARTREAAVRSALGAGRLRLVRYALTEALLLSLGGGVLGLALTMWAIGGIRAAAPAYLGLDSALRIDGPVLAFALAASLLTGVAFGLLPALRNSAADPSQVLRGATGGHGRRAGRILSGLVVAEISLALLLLVGGSLMMRSFVHLLDVPLGLRPDGVLTFRVGLPGARYESADRRRAFHTALLERLERLPGATGAAGVSPLPMSSEYSGSGFTIVGRPEPADWHAMSAQYLSATPHYFRTMGIPVRLGREFEEGDGVSRQVVIVNEALVRKHFPGENPLGHVLGHGGTTVIGTIVGVVGDIRHGGPTIPPDPQIYYPEAGHPLSALSFVVRTTGDPMALAPLVRQQVQGLDPALPADRIKPMTTMMGETIADLRLITLLLSGFALFALALAAIGVYGVTSYSVRQRRYEIGVRIALGASPRRVLATVVARGAGLAAIGMAIGLPLALSATRLMATMLFGVGPRDARVFTLVPVVLSPQLVP